MPPLTIMVKPASSCCNMRCRYCFYADESSNRTTPSFGLMNSDTLEALIAKALSFAEHQCTFVFQGGEPTLAGLNFYRTLVKLEQKYNTKNITIENMVQTNGYVLNDSWAQFFQKNNFFLGLSVDGPAPVHDAYRRTPDGKNTFSKIMNAASLLRKYHVDFNILTVVTSMAASHPRGIYSFYRDRGFNFQQYIPCLNPLILPDRLPDYTLTPELYGSFLMQLFDLWYTDVKRGHIVYISFFENLLGMIKGLPSASCTQCSQCQKQYVIEADGSVYPCDFYATDSYYLGNIVSDSFLSLDKNREKTGFIEQSAKLPVVCSFCKWRFLCSGGCRRERENGRGQLAVNYFCPSYKRFFEYSFDRLCELCRLR